MDLPRVGVFTDDPALVVTLSLQCRSLEFVPVDGILDLASHDIALVDVRTVEPVADAMGRLARGRPTVAVLGDQVKAPAGVLAVRRPCSLAQLVSVLQAVSGGEVEVKEVDGDVIVLDEPDAATPAPAAAPAPPLFPAHRPSAGAASSRASGRRGAPAVDSWRIGARLARHLSEIHVLAEPLGASTVVTAAIADQLAEVVREQSGADHVALWRRQDEAYVALAAAGDPAIAQTWGLHHDHPVLRRTRGASDGVVLPATGEGDAPCRLGAVGVDEAGPLDVVTVIARDLSVDDLVRIRQMIRGGGSATSADAVAPPRAHAR